MEHIRIKGRILKTFYIVGLIGMLSILVAILVTRTSSRPISDYGDYTRVDGCWTLENGHPVVLTQLGEYVEEWGNTLTLYMKIPEVKTDSTLFYRTKDVSTKVSVDGKELYRTASYDSPFYNKSPGNMWNSVKISRNEAGKILKMEIYLAYDKNAVTMDHTFLGDKGDIIHDLVGAKIWAILISLLMLVLGLVMILIDIVPFYHDYVKHHASLYLGLYAALIGIWSLLETSVLQIFFEDGRILQLMDNMVMIVDNFPLLLYLDCFYRVFERRIFRIYAYMQIIYILVAATVQFMPGIDMHAVIKGSWIFNYTNNFIMVGFVFHSVIYYIKNKTFNIAKRIQFLGVMCLIGSGFYSVLHYTAADEMDRAQYLRVGMLGFIICFGISSQVQTLRLVLRGMKYSIVQELAYTDGLTNVGNRTAYMEKIEQLSREVKQYVGIVIFDINNLKVVNDKQGHKYGDRLIQIVSEIIDSSFGMLGSIYRIGGDEFCVILEGQCVEKSYEEQRKVFENIILEKNEAKVLPFEIQVAKGFSVCERTTTSLLNRAVAEADGKMYSNKMWMKGNQ